MKQTATAPSPSASRRTGGIALVTVLGTALVILALLMVITNLTIRSSRVTARDITSTRLMQLADGYSDWGRLVLADNYKNAKLGSLDGWLNKISSNRVAITPTDPRVAVLDGDHVRTMDGVTLGWKITRVSPAKQPDAWVEIAATAKDANDNAQTVVRTVRFGQEDVFKLALLTEKVDCMFCHLTVNGDVGSIGKFRPGWGSEGGDGAGSGGGSSIRGDVYIADLASKDQPAPNSVNGTAVTGALKENFNDDPLPLEEQPNGTKKARFPGLDRELASGARGTVSGGVIQTVAPGGSFGARQSVPGGTLSNTYDGNLILEGTDANPIVLDGDIYVSGDVVIKGVVKGRGAIYAGRNMYVAGNLTNKSKADKPGQGACAGISDENVCATKNIAAGKDETRLSAGNNIIMGDWTEQDAAGQKLARNDRQSADYYRSQFGLYEGATRYVRKGSGEEIEFDGSKYLDQLGRVVDPTEVKTVTGPQDAYRTLIAPGNTDAAGNFKPWMTDAEYQGLLGRENIPQSTWRSEFDRARFADAAAVAAELEAAGLPAGSPETAAIAAAIFSGTNGDFAYNGKDANGNMVSGYANVSGGTLRVAVNESRTYKTEVTELDAFLYANGRIAGKLSNRGGYINGGMIAREIGVLAPGRNANNNYWIPEPARTAYNTCDTSKASDTAVHAANANGNCDYAINYDYRLRNGGYGYNLYLGETGTTFEWQLDLDGSKKVMLP